MPQDMPLWLTAVWFGLVIILRFTDNVNIYSPALQTDAGTRVVMECSFGAMKLMLRILSVSMAACQGIRVQKWLTQCSLNTVMWCRHTKTHSYWVPLPLLETGCLRKSSCGWIPTTFMVSILNQWLEMLFVKFNSSLVLKKWQGQCMKYYKSLHSIVAFPNSGYSQGNRN